MQHYTYRVDIRIWHPSIDPSEITKVLAITPSVTHHVGKQRQTPKGNLLEGNYRETYWSADPFSYGEYSSVDELVEDVLTDIIKYMSPHHDFLHNLRSGGARVIVQVSTQGNRNYAIELSPDLLLGFAKLGISLAHDVYPCIQA